MVCSQYHPASIGYSPRFQHLIAGWGLRSKVTLWAFPTTKSASVPAVDIKRPHHPSHETQIGLMERSVGVLGHRIPSGMGISGILTRHPPHLPPCHRPLHSRHPPTSPHRTTFHHPSVPSLTIPPPLLGSGTGNLCIHSSYLVQPIQQHFLRRVALTSPFVGTQGAHLILPSDFAPFP